ncbi:EscV/YscV/HrcV family type III secretion system export apparatus protein [Xylophilus rhododendri]|uniref:EscV/YscV/HrcV family type III secretion system export apparatus protein n=1 Tax=Xylophilus rhododendri TaxID=2697032 RepID=A0A857J7R5_9BURK|nr:FHIPEP family type III secretion protein [Xylophilus rhododendri]QHJ00015.1 EscV/YscV/HrcV family type III secretion system export apparatus protein [Xylophilus rhododendri]
MKARRPFGGELATAGLVIAIVGLMILPLPPPVIDALLAVNITLSVLLLMSALYAPTAVSMSSFPSLLLFTTLLRLSLNIAATKAILLRGDAGHIIESFGNLVVGGNLLVGMTVFVIIAAVQFIVIAKGSERASEVSARFALDGLPGQQMSIDAELRAGSMTADEARRKRAMLAMESKLHGSMDGAMKFVKGDAIAALVITIINICAGITIGVSYHEMSMAVAAQKYSVLSIGDAMVSQIPSLLISVAAGVLTTRVLDTRTAKRDSLGQEVVRQLGSSTPALYMSSLLLVGFAAVPGFPYPLFLTASAGLALCAWRLQRGAAPGGEGADAETSDGRRMPSLRGYGAKGEAPSITDAAPVFASPLGLRLSEAMVPRLQPAALDDAFRVARAALEEEYGVPFPGMAVWSSQMAEGRGYDVLVQDVPVETRPLPPPGLAQLETAVATDVVAVLARNAHLFVGIQETQWMFDKLNADYPGLITEVQKVLPLQRVADVLRRLLEEQIPIRNLRSILESLVYWGPKEKDVLVLTEYVRGDLGRMIAWRAGGSARKLHAVFLQVDLEQLIRQGIKPTPTGNFLTLPPEQVAGAIEAIQRVSGEQPRDDLAIVTAMDIRRYVRRMIQQRLPWLNVFSFHELGEHLELVSAGEARLAEPPRGGGGMGAPGMR